MNVWIKQLVISVFDLSTHGQNVENNSKTYILDYGNQKWHWEMKYEEQNNDNSLLQYYTQFEIRYSFEILLILT